jgi:hypothetical protein
MSKLMLDKSHFAFFDMAYQVGLAHVTSIVVLTYEQEISTDQTKIITAV